MAVEDQGVNIRVTATLSSPVGRAPALDALLIYAAARDAGMPPVIGDADPAGQPKPPIVESRGIYLATVGMVDAVGHQMRWVQRPSPLKRHLRHDEAKRKLKLSTGQGKPTRSPMRTAYGVQVTWFAVASDVDEVRRLLGEQITHIGPRRSAGYGNVTSWSIDVVDGWGGFPVMDEDGAPLRPLPMDWPKLNHSAGRPYRARLTPPYWSSAVDRVDCIIPRWMEV